MEVFNPKILDASIRDVSSYLTDNQKVDLLLYAMRCLQFAGRSRTVIENAIQSCLQVSTLTPENVAKARILRARARIASGWNVQAQDDLQAALAAEPDNPEAKALLHQRSVTVEKLLAPLPTHHLTARVSNEVWREIALHLPRRDLKALLFVPHPLSRIASQLLFWELDLHFTGSGGSGYGGASDGEDMGSPSSSPGADYARTSDLSHAHRSADILTRLITDPAFAAVVRTLRIYALGRGAEGSRESEGSWSGAGTGTGTGSFAFQTGMLMNALPKLINLRNVHLSSTSEGIVMVLRVLGRTCPRLRGLSLKSPDAPADLSFLDFKHLAHFSYTTSLPPSSLSPHLSHAHAHSLSPHPSIPSTASFHTLLSQNKTTLKSIALDLSSPLSFSSSSLASSSSHAHAHTPSLNPSLTAHWLFPSPSLSIRNLTHIFFTGPIPASSTLFADILANGRQLETLDITCTALECTRCSTQILSVMQCEDVVVPFLRHFALRIASLGRRSNANAASNSSLINSNSNSNPHQNQHQTQAGAGDASLLPTLSSLLRSRPLLRALTVLIPLPEIQRAVGFDAATWGVLPTLEGLRGLGMSWPADLAPGLGGWLVPRGVRSLRVEFGEWGVGSNGGGRDVGAFLGQLRPGIPPNLRFISLSELPVRSPAHIIELGFPMVRVLRMGNTFWTVHRPGSSSPSSTSFGIPSSTSGYRDSPRAHYSSASTTSTSASATPTLSGPGASTRPLSVLSSHAGHGHGHLLTHGATHPHSHAHTNGGGISSTTASVAVGGSLSGAGRLLAPAGSGPVSASHTASRGGSERDTRDRSEREKRDTRGERDSRSERYERTEQRYTGLGSSSAAFELELWPRRRAMYHATEWLEWLGCEDAMVRDGSGFPV